MSDIKVYYGRDSTSYGVKNTKGKLYRTKLEVSLNDTCRVGKPLLRQYSRCDYSGALREIVSQLQNRQDKNESM